MINMFKVLDGQAINDLEEEERLRMFVGFTRHFYEGLNFA
jgi:hypothetical protein